MRDRPDLVENHLVQPKRGFVWAQPHVPARSHGCRALEPDPRQLWSAWSAAAIPCVNLYVDKEVHFSHWQCFVPAWCQKLICGPEKWVEKWSI